MQSFKQIPCQNYIQLRFNQKNLNQASQQQALIKYKRNAQVLAQIFSFQRKPIPNFQSECNINQQRIQQIKLEMAHQQEQHKNKMLNIQKTTEKFEEFMKKAQNLQTKEQLKEFVQQLKQNGMYEDTHPYFVKDSPFYLNSTDEQFLQVKQLRNIGINQQPQKGLNILQIN